MRSMTSLAGLLMVSVATGCGSSGSGGSSGGSSAIPHTPLKGTINGQPWTASFGIARQMYGESSSERFINVYDDFDGGSCGQIDGVDTDPQLLTTIPWTANEALTLSLQTNFTINFQSGGESQNDVVTSGRIELDAAPIPPDGGTAITTMRFSGAYDANNTVEGQVQILVCN